LRKGSIVGHLARDIVVRVVAGLLVSVLSVYVFAVLRLPRQPGGQSGVVASLLRAFRGGAAPADGSAADETVGTLTIAVNGVRKRFIAVRKAELAAVRVKGLSAYFSGVGNAEGEGVALVIPQGARPGQVFTAADHPSRYGEPGFDLAYREKDGTLHRIGQDRGADVRAEVTRYTGPGGTIEGTIEGTFPGSAGGSVRLSGGRFGVAVRSR